MAIKINKDIQISDSNVSLGNINKYSTSEIEIGTYIDGKPVYRKAISGISPTKLNDWTTISTLTNIDNLISIKGYVKPSNGTQIYDLFFYEYCSWYINKVDSSLNIYPRIGFIAGQFYSVIVEYTKTTD